MKKNLQLVLILAFVSTACAPAKTPTPTPIVKATVPSASIPTQTPAITATVTPVLDGYPAFETGISVIHFPGLATITNQVEMRLERFDIMPSSVVAYLCFDKPSKRYGSMNWTIGQSSLQVGRANGQMKTSTLLYDATERYIAEDFIPTFGPTNGNSRCEKLAFQFEQSDGLKVLAAGVDRTTDFTLSVLNLKQIDTDLYLFDGPWVYSIILNP